MVSLTSLTVGLPPHASEVVGAVKLGVAGQSMVALLPCPPIVGLHEQPIGLSAIKIAAQRLLAEIVADPVPVEPVVAFIAHPAPFVALAFIRGLPYIWFRVRLPGDPVANEVIDRLSFAAANIRTAALAVTVVIAVTPEI